MLTGEAARLSCAKAFMSFIISIKVIKIEFKKFYNYDVYDDSGREYTRKELVLILGLSQSYTDELIRKAANGINNDHFKLKHIIVKDIKKQS